MTPAGAAMIAAAKADGSWTLLDAVEDLVVPDDLAAAFDRHSGSRAQWDGFPPLGTQSDPHVDRHRQAPGDTSHAGRADGVARRAWRAGTLTSRFRVG